MFFTVFLERMITNMKNLTKIQDETLAYLKTHITKRIPTFEQMRIDLGLNSDSVLLSRLRALQKKGYVNDKYLPIKKELDNDSL